MKKNVLITCLSVALVTSIALNIYLLKSNKDVQTNTVQLQEELDSFKTNYEKELNNAKAQLTESKTIIDKLEDTISNVETQLTQKQEEYQSMLEAERKAAEEAARRAAEEAAAKQQSQGGYHKAEEPAPVDPPKQSSSSGGGGGRLGGLSGITEGGGNGSLNIR